MIKVSCSDIITLTGEKDVRLRGKRNMVAFLFGFSMSSLYVNFVGIDQRQYTFDLDFKRPFKLEY